MKRLDEVLDRLYESEINFSISCFWDNNVDVKLGDEMNGFAAKSNVKSAAEAADWLDREARRLYPDSTYSRGVNPEDAG